MNTILMQRACKAYVENNISVWPLWEKPIQKDVKVKEKDIDEEVKKIEEIETRFVKTLRIKY